MLHAIPVKLTVKDVEDGQQILLLGDPITGLLSVMDSVHHEVHEGEMFAFERSASISNGANMDIRFKTGAKRVHTGLSIAAAGQCVVSLYEAATISAGTPLSIYNMNRTSSNSPLSSAFHTPTVGATGSVALVDGRLIAGGSTVQTRIGGAARIGSEYILKPNTEYLLRITNTSGVAAVINPVFEFYEE